MGNMQEAGVTGFICRLCSEMHRIVILLYGEQGMKRQLVEKINKFLNVNISPNDQLPKTVCLKCMRQIEQTHNFMELVQKNYRVQLGTRQNRENTELEASTIQQNSEPPDPTEENRAGPEQNQNTVSIVILDPSSSTSNNSNSIARTDSNLTENVDSPSINRSN